MIPCNFNPAPGGLVGLGVSPGYGLLSPSLSWTISQLASSASWPGHWKGCSLSYPCLVSEPSQAGKVCVSGHKNIPKGSGHWCCASSHQKTKLMSINVWSRAARAGCSSVAWPISVRDAAAHILTTPPGSLLGMSLHTPSCWIRPANCFPTEIKAGLRESLSFPCQPRGLGLALYPN